jgi:hypothetical protein
VPSGSRPSEILIPPERLKGRLVRKGPPREVALKSESRTGVGVTTLSRLIAYPLRADRARACVRGSEGGAHRPHAAGRRLGNQALLGDLHGRAQLELHPAVQIAEIVPNQQSQPLGTAGTSPGRNRRGCAAARHNALDRAAAAVEGEAPTPRLPRLPRSNDSRQVSACDVHGHGHLAAPGEDPANVASTHEPLGLESEGGRAFR